jgi:hypothetical protein
MRDFVKDGTVTAFQLWSPYNEGWLAAHFAKGVVEGTITNEPGQTFEVPNLGTDHDRREQRDEHPGGADDFRPQQHRRLRFLIVARPWARTTHPGHSRRGGFSDGDRQ